MSSSEIQGVTQSVVSLLTSGEPNSVFLVAPLGSGKTTALTRIAGALRAKGQTLHVFGSAEPRPAPATTTLVIDDLHTLATNPGTRAGLGWVHRWVGAGVSAASASLGLPAASEVIDLEPVSRREAARLLEECGRVDTSEIESAAVDNLLVASWIRERASQCPSCTGVSQAEIDLMLLERYCGEWLGRDERSSLIALSAATYLTIEALELTLEDPSGARSLWQRLRTSVFVENRPQGLVCAPLLRGALSRHFARSSPILRDSVLKRLDYAKSQRMVLAPPTLESLEAWASVRNQRRGEEPVDTSGLRRTKHGPRQSWSPIPWLADASELCDALEHCRQVGFVDVVSGRGDRPVAVLSGVRVESGAIPDSVRDARFLRRALPRLLRKSQRAGVPLLVLPVMALAPELSPSSAAGRLLFSTLLQRLLEHEPVGHSYHVVQDPERFVEQLAAVELLAAEVERFDRDDQRHTALVIDWRRRSFRDVIQRSIAAMEHDEASHRQSFAEQLRMQVDRAAQRNGLSKREVEVLNLLVLGRNSEDIGVALGISARTAKFHQANVLQKLGADTRHDIIRVLM